MLALSRDKKREFGILPGILAKTACTIAMVAILASCGGSNDGYSYTVRGTVSGLVGGGLVLQNNGGDDVTISANGTFTFAKALANGASYSVTVKTPPPVLSQTCAVVNSSGTIDKSPATNVQVNCVAPPPRLVVDPLGKVAFASNYKDNEISVYTINGTTGELALETTLTAGTNPNAITVHPLEKFVYAANLNSITTNISAYTFDNTGDLTEVSGSRFSAGTNPSSVMIDPLGKFAYVANMGSNTISAYTIDTTTTLGALTAIAGSPFTAGTNPSSVTIDPSGKFAYVSNTGSNTISAYTIDTTTGALTAVAGSPFPAGMNPAAVTIIPSTAALSGKYAYVANTGSNTISVYAIDQTSGALTALSPISTEGNPSTIAIDPTGQFALTANYSSSTISSYTINQTTGVLVWVSTVSTGTNPCQVAIDPTGQFAYTANVNSNNVSAYAINPSTGALTQVTNSPFTAGTNPYLVTINPETTKKFAYVLNADNTISAYEIETDGALTEVVP